MERDRPQPLTRRILLYEFTCSGGLLNRCDSNFHSLAREGWAMLRALAADLAAIPGMLLQVLVDRRGLPGPLPNCELISVSSPFEERALFKTLSSGADWTIVIAPETDGALLDRCRMVEECGGRLLGPPSQLIGLLADKHATAQHLVAWGICAPSGTDWRPDSFSIRIATPIVVKPLDGAGAQDTYLVHSQSALDELLAHLSERHGGKRAWRLETFHRGIAASASVLCGPAGFLALPPCYQHIQSNEVISYQGGSYPVEPALASRAMSLARRTLETMSGVLGYIGVDMVLGDDPADPVDLVIEVNPRLTTSYVGLRAAAAGNLAEAMLDVADGHTPDLTFLPHRLDFDLDGAVRKLDS